MKSDLENLYNVRFSVIERVHKKKLWQTFCKEFLQRYIPKTSVVLDIGAGSCEFINFIKAKKKYALDLNPITKLSANQNVKVFQRSAEDIDKIFKQSIDIAFMSNFLEHLESKKVVYIVLKKTLASLKPGGKLLIMQPDISRAGAKYWDYFDHTVPLTEMSLVEVVRSVGFSIEKVISPFLPWTPKTWWIPPSPLLLKIYLRLRPLQLIFGQQIFLVAKKPGNT